MEHRLRHAPTGYAVALLALLLGPASRAPAQQLATKFADAPADLRASTNAPAFEVRPLLDSQLDTADRFYASRQYADALRAYTEVLPSVADARREQVLFRIAESYRVLGRDTEADAVYKMLVDSYPSSLSVPVAQYRRGEILFKRGQYVPALVLFQTAQVTTDDATRQAARYSIASCQMKLGQEKDALPVLQAFADAQPATEYSVPAAQALAEYQEKQGNWPEALKDWRAVFDRLGDKGDKSLRAQAAGRAALAALKLVPPQPQDAEKLFQAVRQADPDGAYVKLANTGLLDLYFQQERWQELVDLFNQNRDKFLDSSRAQIFLEVARAWYRLKNYPEAIHGFDIFLAQFKDDPLAPIAAYERLAARSEVSRDNILGDTAAFLAAYPQSSYRPAVLFLRAQQYSAAKDFVAAKPMWDELAANPPAGLPEADIRFEAARAHYELKEWKAAADGFAAFAQKFPVHPGVLPARQCQAAALQNQGDSAGAEAAWEEALKVAKAQGKAKEAQAATEQIALLDGILPDRKAALLATLQSILDAYPQSRLWPLAAYTVGAEAFGARQYDKAEPLLSQAKEADAKAWAIPALYRLLWISYQKKDAVQAAARVREYDALVSQIPAGTDNASKVVRVPPAVYYWLGVDAANAAPKRDTDAAYWFAAVTVHPDAGQYLTSAWWELGEANRRLKRWSPAVDAYNAFRAREPKGADSSPVLLALAECQIGAGQYADAKTNLDKVLLQEPEGKNNALARFLVGQSYLAQKQYADAIKSFATLSLIYKDDDLTPRALSRAAAAADLAGDKAQADGFRKKLQDQYPAYAEPKN